MTHVREQFRLLIRGGLSREILAQVDHFRSAGCRESVAGLRVDPSPGGAGARRSRCWRWPSRLPVK